jgi:orotidine-5'-phosphate decarboxylase
MESILPKHRIVLPLDVSNIVAAQNLVDKLAPHVGLFKVGLEFIYSVIVDLLTKDDEGAAATLCDVRKLAKSIGGWRAFMDVKLSDIPNTVGKSSLAVSSMGVRWFNVHASAGTEAIKAAVASRSSSKVLGVTVLTSIDDDECVSIFGDKPGKKVMYFAEKLLKANADGIICSPKEMEILRADDSFNHLFTATPGVRPKTADVNDQKRIMTPGEAIAKGADYLVIGRPITAAPDPVAAAVAIAEEIRLAEFVAKPH